jgi:hypothetical protein
VQLLQQQISHQQPLQLTRILQQTPMQQLLLMLVLILVLVRLQLRI